MQLLDCEKHLLFLVIMMSSYNRHKTHRDICIHIHNKTHYPFLPVFILLPFISHFCLCSSLYPALRSATKCAVESFEDEDIAEDFIPRDECIGNTVMCGGVLLFERLEKAVTQGIKLPSIRQEKFEKNSSQKWIEMESLWCGGVVLNFAIKLPNILKKSRIEWEWHFLSWSDWLCLYDNLLLFVLSYAR